MSTGVSSIPTSLCGLEADSFPLCSIKKYKPIVAQLLYAATGCRGTITSETTFALDEFLLSFIAHMAVCSLLRHSLAPSIQYYPDHCLAPQHPILIASDSVLLLTPSS